MTSRDAELMARCLVLAAKARGRTAPNPIVGCVITDRGGRIVAEGYHRRAGEAHAEVEALTALGGRARGGTLYVNLEPCNHHGRTPPCAPYVAAAGLRRVVIGQADPIRGHKGGAGLLRKAGLIVDVGVLGQECMAANAPFVTWAKRQRPFVIGKAAMSLDGKIATRCGHSQWITGKQARRDGHQLRDQCDAIVVGVRTVLADDPKLTTRGIAGGRDPIVVVVDSLLRTPASARVLPANGRGGAVWIVTTVRAPVAREKRLVARGAQVIRVAAVEGRVDVRAMLGELARRNVTSLVIEGGAELHASFVAADLVDDLRLYLAPIVIGGPAKSWVGGRGIERLGEASRWRFVDPVRAVGEDRVLRLVRPRAWLKVSSPT